VILVPLRKYANLRTRICRPLGLTEDDRDRVLQVARGRLGHSYDLKNVVDLARYLIRTPPVPTQWRRRMLALGSGDPTRAICSTMIAEAFQSVRYPILPDLATVRTGECDACVEELLHIRHHSLFAPRDFDLSPYFGIVKPALEAEFDYRRLRWADLAQVGMPAPDISPPPDRAPA
ncbi:MAG: lipo-like protein, partial [Proteobacteria bacterium]|nr:lipo-like protein [Pseudomonadota bacterium]